MLPLSPARFVPSGWKRWVRPPARPVSGPPGIRLTAVPWRAPRSPGARERARARCREPALRLARLRPQCACVAAAVAAAAASLLRLRAGGRGSSVLSLCDVPRARGAQSPLQTHVGAASTCSGLMLRNLKLKDCSRLPPRPVPLREARLCSVSLQGPAVQHGEHPLAGRRSSWGPD